MERMEQNDIIIYNTDDGKSSVVLVGAEGMVWLNQLQMAELFATSKQSISYHITNILKEKELPKIAVVKNILTTASDGKQYMVEHYSLDILWNGQMLENLIWGLLHGKVVLSANKIYSLPRITFKRANWIN